MKNDDKKPDPIVKLNFNPKSHDAKVEKAVATEADQRQAREQKKLKRLVHIAYEQWKKKVKSKARTPKDILTLTYKLQELIGSYESACKNCGMEEWWKFTMEILADKIAQCHSTLIMANNQFTPIIPESATLLDSDNDAIVVEQLKRDIAPVNFRSYEEFLKISAVELFTKKSLFTGFCLDGSLIVAVFKDGTTAGVGVVANGTALEALPTVEQFAEALKAIDEVKEEPK